MPVDGVTIRGARMPLRRRQPSPNDTLQAEVATDRPSASERYGLWLHITHSADYSRKQPRSSGFAHQLLRDWRRWSRAERIVAGCMLAILLVGTPLLFAAVVNW